MKPRIVASQYEVERAQVGDERLQRTAEGELWVLRDCSGVVHALQIGQQSCRGLTPLDDGVPLLLCGEQAFDGGTARAFEIREYLVQHFRIGEMIVGEWSDAEVVCERVETTSESTQNVAVIGAWVRSIEVGWVLHDPCILEVDHDRRRHDDCLHSLCGRGSRAHVPTNAVRSPRATLDAHSSIASERHWINHLPLRDPSRPQEELMTLRIGDTAPDFEAETTSGPIQFHEWLGDSWGVLFSHPKDFTPVCTTELGYMAKLKPEFDKRNVKVIGLSVDPVDSHAKWADDIEETQGYAPNYPMIGDPELKVAKAWGMLPAELAGTSQGRTPADNQTVRNVFVVGPDKKIKLILVYPMTTGRNFDEVLRVIDSLQLTAKHKVATPVNWKHGDDVIIAGSVSDDEAKAQYPDGWKAPKPYIRIVPQPG
jgi:alkyl hydroperoxide reductase subunit AhpC